MLYIFSLYCFCSRKSTCMNIKDGVLALVEWMASIAECSGSFYDAIDDHNQQLYFHVFSDPRTIKFHSAS